MAMSKLEWQRQVRAEGAKMREESRKERIQKIADITRRWKEGFAALKVENDRLQAELKEWWELDQDQIQNYVIENLERGGPFVLR